VNILFYDTEQTTYNKGSPFDPRNFNVLICWDYNGTRGHAFYDDPAGRGRFAELLRGCDVAVAFNAKYDLHWLRKLGLPLPKRNHCCQVAEFILERQSTPYPSLEGCATKYGVHGKFDVVQKEYWDKGIQTNDIPRPILLEYCAQDVEALKQIYYKQVIPDHQKMLISITMQDLAVLEEIEWNGMHFNPNVVKEKQQQIATEIEQIKTKLNLFHNIGVFNWASNAHLSALLYGGTIIEEKRVPIGVFKSGAKVGQPRFRVEYVEHPLPRMYNPPKGSELAKAGQWSTDEDNLLKIKGGNKELIEGILRIKELGKLQSTYVAGLLEKHRAMNWKENYIYGQYNQVVAGTGRLSSTNPNMQNMSGDILDMFETRWQ
jgi:DNA polymerase I-like protein with 3'-5' exonuclease and polymerase domains